MVVDMTVLMSKAMLIGVMAMTPESHRMKHADIEKSLAGIRKQVTLPLLNQILVQYLYFYRDVPVEDIGKSIAFSESADGKWAIAVLKKGLFDGLNDFGKALGFRIGNEYQKMMQKN